MASIRKWIRGKLDSRPKGKEKERQLAHEQEQEHEESLLFLPATRPRQLTPESAHGNKDADGSRLLENYGVLGRAPYEVRRRILIEAFGGRTLHMDLSCRHPLARKSRNAETFRCTASESNVSAVMAAPAPARIHRHCGLGSELVPDTGRPPEWQWFGCVCHRRAGYSEIEAEHRYGAMETSQSIEPCDDECLEGSKSMCSCADQSNNSDGTAACFVGAMGWLLACRQAYTDGIDVLYSTNTFHISSLDLQLNLPRLLPRHHLERITSLELMWKLNTIQASKVPIKDYVKPLWDSHSNPNPHEQEQDRTESPLHMLCAMIPATFPHLRSLYISFQCWLDSGSAKGGPGVDVISELETIFLRPVEDMMRDYCLGRSRQGQGHRSMEFNVAIQRGAWRVLLAKYHKLLGAKLKLESVDELSRGRFWKPLRLRLNGGTASATASAGGGSGSGSGAGYEENSQEDDFGYWICGGWEDMKVFGHDYWIMTNWGDKWTGTKDTY